MTARSPFGQTAEYDPHCTFSDEVRALPRLGRPTLRDARALVLRRALARPLKVLVALLAGQGPRDIGSALLLQDTTRTLGLTSIVTADERPHALSSLMLNGRRDRPAPRTRPRVGGLIIAQNEEALLPRALRSLDPLVNELVVVDGGSEDRTRDIARAHGALVVDRPFDQDFAAQRNAGLDALNCDWVLTLDADEYFSAELTSVLGSLLEHELDVEAVCMPLLNRVGLDPLPTNWPDLQARLFRSHLRYQGVVHERIHFARAVLLPVDGPYLQHYKDNLRHYTNALRYSEIDSSPYTEQQLTWLKSETERLRKEANGGPTSQGQ